MSDMAVAGGRAAWRGRLGTETLAAREAPDARRVLQLALAGLWLLDAVLQYQSFMYSKSFTQMIAATAAGKRLKDGGPSNRTWRTWKIASPRR